MKKFYFIIFCWFLSYTANSQELSLTELLNLTMQSSQKFDHFLTKKGYIKGGTALDYPVYAFQSKFNSKRKKDKNILRSIEKFQKGPNHSLVFRTSSLRECTALKGKLKKEGFKCNDSISAGDKPLQLRKKNINVLVNTVIEKTDTLYSFNFNLKELPSPDSINYANDLLQFTSHDELIEMFGTSNVKKDLYFFDEKVIRPCSVLFPGSDRQAVFIWDQGSSSSGLSSVIIGGSLRIESDMNSTSAVAQNNWSLANGIQCNMGLKELLAMNGNDLKFYGRQSGLFMTLTPQNTGKINMEGINIILGCHNCTGIKLLDSATVSAEEALNNGLGMFVIMVMLTPPEVNEQEKSAGKYFQVKAF